MKELAVKLWHATALATVFAAGCIIVSFFVPGRLNGADGAILFVIGMFGVIVGSISTCTFWDEDRTKEKHRYVWRSRRHQHFGER